MPVYYARVAILLTPALIVGALWGLDVWPFRKSAPGGPQGDKPARTEFWFEDVAAAKGIDFKHFDPHTELHLIPETMGSGIAWIDYDSDGWPDLFCVQSSPLPPASPDGAPVSRLFRNNRDGTFHDVTQLTGLNVRGYGMGCAVGDYDNDGFDDLVVTFLGGIRLFHNERAPDGGRRFADVTAASALADPHWATSCAWADLDGDGLLDLYVCNYVEIDPQKPVTCFDQTKRLYYQCSPTTYPLTTHRLFRNKGKGVFEDVSESSGVRSAPAAPGLAVVAIDLDSDGLLDIYVANDMYPAYLFHNKGGMRFEEKALFSGCALGPGGIRVAGMGIVVADLDGSGRPSLFITNFQNSPNVVFLNRGNLRFDEANNLTGLGPPSMPRLKWGTVLLDANLDAVADIAVANGHVHRPAEEVFGIPYAQEAQLFLGEGRGRYRDASEEAGADFRVRRAGRGLAVADFDNDGLPDLTLSCVGGPLALLRNRRLTENNWISLEVVGDGLKSNRNAVGATIKVEAGGKGQHFWIAGGGSYLSASDRRLLVGLGAAEKADKVIVKYPSGKVQVYTDLPARGWWRLTEGRDAAEDGTPRKP